MFPLSINASIMLDTEISIYFLTVFLQKYDLKPFNVTIKTAKFQCFGDDLVTVG